MPNRHRQHDVASGAAPSGAARIACFEWARAAGCVAVVALHVFVALCNAHGYDALGPTRLFVEATLSIVLTRWAVPVFFMVSGALLLDPAKDLGWERIWRYVSRMLFVLGTFGLAFCLVESAYNNGGLSLAVVGEALINLVTARSWGHLWYVYALLGLYALTPALRLLVTGADRRTLTLTITVLYVLVLVIPTVSHLAGNTVTLPLNLAPAVVYYLLGWYVWTYLRLDTATACAGIASLVAMIAGQWLGHGELALPEYCLVAPYGALVILLFARYARRPINEVAVADALANRSFGIYVVHPIFLHALVRFVDPLALPVGAFELLAFAVALAGSFVLVDVVRKIPGFAGRL